MYERPSGGRITSFGRSFVTITGGLGKRLASKAALGLYRRQRLNRTFGVLRKERKLLLAQHAAHI